MITVANLVKRYGANEILKGISLEIQKGEVHSIIGPSGGGKSTFLRCINGLENFQSGELRVGGHVLTPMTNPRSDARLLEAVRRQVGFVFQQFNLFPHLTVLENVIEAPIHVLKLKRSEAKQRAEQLLARVGLSSKCGAYPRDLSGGQQQRVAIARTLVMGPAVILFDEPTSALDPVMAGEILALMEDLAKDGQTMIVVTHSMGFARNVASQIHVFADGYDVENGPPSKVFGSPQHATTQSFLSQTAKG
ncbi:MAG TPA: amino acid ABC transporter ATP-binding protein [Bryobacteraceae bacterium]|jgi:polar amino acid transport system ATP-binding protein|nr:amino acid ABC transporter ATP-binding protein [Bryobacteraceae bacterium]